MRLKVGVLLYANSESEVPLTVPVLRDVEEEEGGGGSGRLIALPWRFPRLAICSEGGRLLLGEARLSSLFAVCRRCPG